MSFVTFLSCWKCLQCFLDGVFHRCWIGLADFLQCESNKQTIHFKRGFFSLATAKAKNKRCQIVHSELRQLEHSQKNVRAHIQALLVLA